MSGYYGVLILTLIIGAGASLYCSSQLKKYSHVPCSYGLTGAEIANRMRYDKGITNVGINRGGPNQDYFDPRTNSITLGTEVFSERSITAVATAVHEMGHACQYADGYMFMKFRGALLPAVNICSSAWVFIFMLGLFAGSMGQFFIQLAIIMFAVVLLFHLITLPVEFDASRRGLAYLKSTGMGDSELIASSNVLRACALTYVAAALTAVLQLVYMLGISRE